MGRANYDLPDDKLAKVVRLSGAHSKKEALVIAMDEYLKKKKLERLSRSHGKIPLKWTKRTLRNYRG
jgi:hypothetical protein